MSNTTEERERLTPPLTGQEARDVQLLIDEETRRLGRHRNRNNSMLNLDYEREIEEALAAYRAVAETRHRRAEASRAYRRRQGAAV